jgi:hypothetical protein
MEIADATALTDLVEVQLASLATLITEDGYELVCNQTILELGWSYPVTTSTKVFWLIKRATRHALYLLMIAAAYKFKYKQVNLQHRFDHFKSIIDTMDEEFNNALISDVGVFITSTVDSNTFKMFGTKIDAGFAYDSIGNDVTYNSDRLVNFSPLEG